MSIIRKDRKPPYICTPITGKTKEDIFKQLQMIIKQEPDIIEWRADYFIDLSNTTLVLRILEEMKNKTTIPLLFTIRGAQEGGEPIALTDTEKVKLILEVCEMSAVEIIDFETSNDEKDVTEIRKASRAKDKKLILSYHNFHFTPENEVLISKAQEAERLGADIAKFAVMPKEKADVLRLLEVTRSIDHQLAIPIVTMSMGDIGGLSRVIGWAYGSIITFGVGVESSAPGQVPVKKLRETIQLTQELVPSWGE